MRVAFENAVIDEHGVEGGQRHGGGDGHDLEGEYRQQQLFVGQQIAAHEPVHSDTPVLFDDTGMAGYDPIPAPTGLSFSEPQGASYRVLTLSMLGSHSGRRKFLRSIAL